MMQKYLTVALVELGSADSCEIKVNGQTVLACKAEIMDGDVIEPLDFEVMKDLIIDRTIMDGRVKELELFIDECDTYHCPANIKPEDYENSKKNLEVVLNVYPVYRYVLL